MNNGTKFVKTKDKETADKLKDSGLKLLNYDGKVWTFINSLSNKTNFNKENVFYTDTLTF